MPMIREAIVTTIDRSGVAHLAPLGLIEDGQGWVIAPFRPSTTLDNLVETPFAVANYTDDARIFAGLVTGRRDWPLVPAAKFPVPRLAGALAHAELRVAHVEDRCRAPPVPLRDFASRAACAFRGVQPGSQRRSRMRHPPHPAAHASARQNRAGDRLSFHRNRKDSGSPRAARLGPGSCKSAKRFTRKIERRREVRQPLPGRNRRPCSAPPGRPRSDRRKQ